jgi:hypothetical protein
MTPKDKAIELCQKFAYTSFQDEFNDGATLPLHIAKKCAKIAVTEILKKCSVVEFQYFFEVKQEIENL